MSSEMQHALERLAESVDNLLADMRDRAIARGDFEAGPAGRNVAVLDCGHGVLLGAESALDAARKALDGQRPLDDAAYIAGALAMREKIARCIAMNPREEIFEIACHIRENIKPPAPEQAMQWDSDAREMLRERANG